MSEEQEKNLIGYDPLAWLTQQPVSNDKAIETNLSIDIASNHLIASETTESVIDSSQQNQIETTLNQTDRLASLSNAIVLDAVLSIRNVQTFHQRLAEILQTFDSIELDASQVTAIDTASLQLLLILKRTALNLGKQVTIDFPSDKFIEASNLLGISEMLEVDQAFAGLF